MMTIDTELVLTRSFDAPREVVFKAWTEIDQLLKWICPTGFSILFGEGDIRPGGKWRSGMRSPDGVDYVTVGTYREIVPPEKLVFTHTWEYDEPRPETLVTILFEEAAGGRTKMTFTQTGFSSVKTRDAHEEGWSQSLDKLDLFLSKKLKVTTATDCEIMFKRAFDAPARLVFDAFTKPEHLSRWFGCEHTEMLSCEIDLRVGGEYLFLSRISGDEFPFKGVYKVINPPTRLVYTQIFDLDAYRDSETLIAIDFEERDGRTYMTAVNTFPSKEARDTVIGFGVENGARQSYEKLDEVLRTME